MPILINRTLPLPNIRIYSAISVALVSCCIYYSISATSDPNWKLQNNTTSNTITSVIFANIANNENNEVSSTVDKIVPPTPIEDVHKNGDGENGEYLSFELKATAMVEDDDRTIMQKLTDVYSFMSQEPVCIWTLINMAYCCLILVAITIQKVVFGELRISEKQHMKDKFWNFIFYKFIFIFGVVNVQYFQEVVLWVSWFSVLGFLSLLSQLCKDRFEYLSFSPTTPGWSHFRLVILLSVILLVSGIMFIISVGVGLFSGINTFSFMAAECVLLSLRTMHVLLRYVMFLYDIRQSGISTSETISWDKRGPVAYYIELVFEVCALLIDLLHHLHMLLWSNIFLSMASLVILMQLRYLMNEIQRRYKKHRNYLWVLNHMEKSYPLATQADLSQNSDNCAICWEKMDSARKLPCSHLFHNSCLQSWLEQDTSCPTCRLGLSVQSSSHINLHQNEMRIDDQDNVGRGIANNHFFHFNGSRYVSWLPNFSVEVTHINNLMNRNEFVPPQNHTSQLRNMARHVQELFPRFPLSILITDLQTSRSVEITIDNILEGRLLIPARFQDMDDMDGAEMAGDISDSSEASNTPITTSFTSASDYYVNASDFAPTLQTTFATTSSTATTYAANYVVPSSTSGYDVQHYIFGNQNDLLHDETTNEDLLPLGDRFSKSSEEREKILQRRKEQLLIIARKKYLEKNKSDLNMPSSSSLHRNKTTSSNNSNSSDD